ncbi:hypothetical protein ACIQXA_07095 [Streptomyces massasporeus]|uniref:hypothetical protein n=1 Tax=Streptomyces massasporeus TaxID=67324 RepID=UPI003823C352
MNTGLRITTFAAALAATFGAAYGVGQGIDPVVADSPPKHGDEHTGPAPEQAEGSGRGGHDTPPAGGLQIFEGGYTLDLDTPRVTAGKQADLRSGDLAYLHVHPNGEPGDGTTRPGPDISFTATEPSSGAYRLFLDFKHDGEVHTAAFTVHAGGAMADSGTPEGHAEDAHGH